MPRWTRCADPAQSTYSIIERDGMRTVIRFAPCGVESPNIMDVKHHYCAYCHEFIMRETSQS